MVNQKVFTWGKYFVKECRIQQASPVEPMPVPDLEICSGVSVDAILGMCAVSLDRQLNFHFTMLER